MYQLKEKKDLADTVAIYGRGREIFRPPTYVPCIVAIGKYRDITLAPNLHDLTLKLSR